MKRPRLLAWLVSLALACAAAVALTPAAAVAAPDAPIAFTSNNLATWQTNGVVWALAQTGGEVFAGGSFTAIRPPGSAIGTNETPAANFVALDAASGVPTSCAMNFTISTGTATIRALAVSPDGRTLSVGGYFDHVNGTYVNSLVAVDIASCSMVPTFHPQVNATVRTILPTSTGVYLGGDFTSVNGTPRGHLAEVTAVGSTTPGALISWAPTTDLTVRSMVLSPDGTDLVVGGDFFTLNGADSHALGIVDPVTGATVKDYPLGFIEQNSVVKDLATDATGFYTANEGTGGGVFDGRIAIDWSTLNQRWRDTCLGATQAVLVYDNVLYAGSHTHDCSSMGEQPDGRRQHLIAETTSSGMEYPWYPDTNDGPSPNVAPPGLPIVEEVGPRAMTVATENNQPYLWVAGEFSTVNGSPQQSLTRFGDGPDLAAPSVTAISSSAITSGTVQLRWRTATDTDDGTLTYNLYRDGGATPVWTGTGSSFWWSRPQLSYTDTGLVPGSWHTYRVTASDGTNTTSSPTYTIRAAPSTLPYASQVLADGAQLYWRYDEASGSFIGDASSGNQNGYFNGGGTYRDGTGAIAGDPSVPLGLNGTSGFVYDETAQPSPSTYSIETWFRTTTTSGGLLVGFGNNQSAASTDYDKHIYMTNSGQLVFGTYNGGTQTVTTPNAYNDGQWHYVVATQGPNGMTLYVDGARVGSNAAATTNQQYNGYWHVGADSLGSWPNQPSSSYFQGVVDETAVYPNVLTPTQVATHYTLGGGTVAVPPVPADSYGKAVYNDSPESYWRLDESSGSTAADASNNGNTGAYGTGVALGTPGALPGTADTAVTLDGASDGTVSATDATATPGSYSTELWFRTTTTSGGKLIGFGNSQTGLSSNYDKHVYMTDGGQLVFGTWNGSADTITSPNAYNDGAWHYLVATQGANGMALYVDGALVGTNPTTTSQSYTGYWRVGGDNLNGWPDQPASDYFAGSVDEAAVYPTALTAAQVAAHYAAATQ